MAQEFQRSPKFFSDDKLKNYVRSGRIYLAVIL